MKPSHKCLLVCLAVAPLATTGVAQETKIQRSELPAAVEKTVTAQSQGATIRGFSREIENGQTYYEAELMVNGRTKDVLMDPTGMIVEVEQEVAIDALPAEVKSGLQSKAGSGKMTCVTQI